jgi:hypothetical protein
MTPLHSTCALPPLTSFAPQQTLKSKHITPLTRTQNALLKEVGILAKLTHPNLVRFCGVCLDPPLVVMEYYRNGSMFKMLECARAAVQQGRTNKVREAGQCTAGNGWVGSYREGPGVPLCVHTKQLHQQQVETQACVLALCRQQHSVAAAHAMTCA